VQVSVEVEETFIANLATIEVELQKTTKMIVEHVF
jgi:hypothetical protein